MSAGLPTQTLETSFVAGLNQKADERAIEQPSLVRAVDVQFDEVGGIQTRKPYASLVTIANIRRAYGLGDEQIVFTNKTLYSYRSATGELVYRGEHLAVAVDEETVFASTSDQVDCDRAELDGTIVYCWTDRIGTVAYVAARDKETGAVVMAPTSFAGIRPRLVALSTKILLSFSDNAGGIYCYALDPASPATALTGASTTVINGGSGGTANDYYDVVRDGTTDEAVFAIRLNPTTSYAVVRMTAALVATRSVKARVCDGPIAVATSQADDRVLVVRCSGADVIGDILVSSTLADSVAATSIGTAATAPSQVTAAIIEGDVGWVFWSSNESDAGTSDWQTEKNYIELSGGVGSVSTLVKHVAVASRAFVYEGDVYLFGVFAGTSLGSGSRPVTNVDFASLQNTYFLYRRDGSLHAKVAASRASGFVHSPGSLPGVALVDGATAFAWCATERRIIPAGEATRAYSARAPRDVTVTFDDNRARRVARLGQTVYITGGEIKQYDGEKIVEVGTHIYPWYFGVAEIAGGSIATNGDYAYRGTYRWDNAKGETDRSTSASIALAVIAAAPGGVAITGAKPLYVTHKTGISVEWWRTAVDPTEDAPFYLVTSQDPTSTTNPNRYLANDATASSLSTVNDELSDADLSALPSNPENYSVLENLAPPPAHLITAGTDRLFLAGIAGDPDRVWYSKLRGDGEVAAFHDALIVHIPQQGGAITGLAFLGETLVVFRETAIYALDGRGYDNTGGGFNYEARLVTTDVGAQNQESIALTPAGLVFASSKGKYLLNRGWTVEYIGAAVSDYDSEPVLAVHVVEAQHQVRWLTASRLLVHDYLVNQWAEWSITGGVSATLWGGQHVVATSTAIRQQRTDFTGVDYGLDVEMLVKFSGLQGFARVRKIQMLGEYRSAHHLRIRTAFDYASSYTDDFYWTVSPTAAGDPLRVKYGPSRQQCHALKLRITAVDTAHTGSPTGEALKLTGLAFEVGLKRGVGHRLPAAQRT